MPTHTVREGESPAQIAIARVGCPKCAIDLVQANPHKETIVYPNGFKTFKELRAGEKLNLPEKWINGELDRRPPTYFAALPYHDGVTPSALGAAAQGVLGDYATLDKVTALVNSLASLDDRSFSQAVDGYARLIDSSVLEALNGENSQAAGVAMQVRTATDWAKQRAEDLATALDNSAAPAATEARLDAQNALSTAIGAAQIALQSYYGGAGPAPIPAPDPAKPAFDTSLSMTVLAAAQAAADAMAADPNYCSSVAQSGSAVNAAIHAFKAAWNASGQPPVPVNTGNYEQLTAAAIQLALGVSPPACAARATPLPTPAPAPVPDHVVAPTESNALSKGEIAGLALLGATVVGGGVALATRRRRRRRR